MQAPPPQAIMLGKLLHDLETQKKKLELLQIVASLDGLLQLPALQGRPQPPTGPMPGQQPDAVLQLLAALASQGQTLPPQLPPPELLSLLLSNSELLKNCNIEINGISTPGLQSADPHAPTQATRMSHMPEAAGPAKTAKATIGEFPVAKKKPEFASLPSLGPYQDSAGTYTGQYKDGRRHGFGTMVYKNGAVYEGLWKLDLRHGYGIYIRPTGGYCQGEFRDDQLNGSGKEEEGANSYEGEFKDFKPHCQGVKKYADGSKYEGEWLTGQWHGTGVYHWPDGRTYTGDWAFNKRNGRGFMTKLDSTKFKQRWVNGDMVEDVLDTNPVKS